MERPHLKPKPDPTNPNIVILYMVTFSITQDDASPGSWSSQKRANLAAGHWQVQDGILVETQGSLRTVDTLFSVPQYGDLHWGLITLEAQAHNTCSVLEGRGLETHLQGRGQQLIEWWLILHRGVVSPGRSYGQTCVFTGPFWMSHREGSDGLKGKETRGRFINSKGGKKIGGLEPWK